MKKKKFFIILFWIFIILFIFVVSITSEDDWHCSSTDEECALRALGEWYDQMNGRLG